MPNWRKVIVSGSDAVLNTVTTTGDIIAGGNIIAQQYIVSSSVYYNTQSYSSGSTIFGDTLDDTHQFTGSFFITGLNLDNNDYNVVIYNPSTGQFFYTSSYANAGTGDNLGNHTATEDLNMASNNIGGANNITAISFDGNLTGSVEGTSSWAQNAVSSSHSWNITDGNEGEGVGSNDTIRFSGQYATTVTYNIASNTVQISTPDLSPSVNALNAASSSYLISASVIGTPDEVEVTSNGPQGILIGLPDDVIISNNLTVDNDISGSGQLFASLSLADETTASQTVMYDTSSGKFYFTGSYGGGGGGTTLTGLDTEVVFFNGNDNPEGDSGFTYKANTKTVTIGTTTPATGNIYANSNLEGAGKHVIEDGKPLSTNAVYSKGRYDLIGLGRSLSGNGGQGIQALGVGGELQPPILPPFSALGNSNTTMAGDLYFGSIYAISDEGTNPITTLYISALEVLPGSPSVSIKNGNIYFTPSESIEYGDSGSIITPKTSASIAFTLAEDSSSLSIKVGKGDLTEVLYVSKSGTQPRIGIGTSNPISAFDIKDIKDDGKGTEMVFKTSRTDRGADVGDLAGTIYFSIDSGSYGDIKTSGSLATLTTQVKEISPEGSYGHFKINTARAAIEAPSELWVMGYNADPVTSGINASVTSGSINIKRGGGSGRGHLTFTDMDNSSALTLTTVTETISGTPDPFFSFNTSSYDGAAFDYTLKKTSAGARTGQLMIIWDGSNLEFTDTSTPSIGTDTTILSASLSGAVVTLTAIDGDGFTFKALIKKL